MSARAQLEPGERLGPFKIEGLLGRGGMGVVHRARNERTQEAVALKVLAPELARDLRVLERFHRESLAASAVVHPNVVRCLGSGEERGTTWLALELVPGGSLADLVVRSGRLPWRDAARLGGEIARALEAIHSAGILHRDLKPANVLLDERGRAKLGDFGLARAHLSKDALTRTGELIGTVEYMAPEQAEGGAVVDERSDLYALGCTLYCLISGKPPFPGAGADVIVKHLTTPAEPLSKHVAGLPRELERLVARLLSKNPADRGTSAAEVATQLEEIAGTAAMQRRTSLRALAPFAVFVVVVAVSLARRAWREQEVAAVVVTPSALPRPSPSPTPPPAWFASLPGSKKPSLPLPAPLEIGPKPGEYVASGSGLVLVYVPGGDVTLGNVDDDDRVDPVDAVPAHRAIVSPFFLGKYEVSNEEFERWVVARGADDKPLSERNAALALPPDHRKDAYRWDGPRVLEFDVNGFEMRYAGVPGASWRRPRGPKEPEPARSLPVVQVPWEDAHDFAKWSGLRLPTEAEWEIAARAPRADGKLAPFPWGEEEPTPEMVNARFVDDRDVPVLQPVNAYATTKSAWGPVQMVGNAREWVLDTNDGLKFYEQLARGEVDPHDACCQGHGPSEPHVVKGGSLKDVKQRLRPSARFAIVGSDDTTGFRVAISADGSPRPRKAP